MATVYLSFGSNVGDRLRMLALAQGLLMRSGIQFLRWSPIYETEPFEMGVEAEWVLNAVAEAEADHSPEELLKLIKEIEGQLGRKKFGRVGENGVLSYAPREIDVDILLWDDVILDIPDLKIPHPHFHERRYQLHPLVDLIPTQMHPVLDKMFRDLLEACEDVSEVRLFTEKLPLS